MKVGIWKWLKWFGWLWFKIVTNWFCSNMIIDWKKESQIELHFQFSKLKFQIILIVVGCIIKGKKVTAHFSKNWEPPKIIYICVDWHFICSIYLKYSGVFSNNHFSTHTALDSLLGSVFHPLNLLLSFSLSLSLAHFPLCFTCLHIM